MIKRAGLESFNLMQAGIESITRQKLNSEQINYLKGQLAIGWANVAIGEKSVSNEADKIANDLMMGMKDLDRKDRTYRDWETDRKSTRLNSSHRSLSRMPSSA